MDEFRVDEPFIDVTNKVKGMVVNSGNISYKYLGPYDEPDGTVAHIYTIYKPYMSVVTDDTNRVKYTDVMSSQAGGRRTHRRKTTRRRSNKRRTTRRHK